MKKILLLLIPILFGCTNAEKKEDEGKVKEHDYQEVSNLHISWNDMFNTSDSNHYVYCYSLTCHNCKDIKNNVIDKALKTGNIIYFCKDNLNIQDIDIKHSIGASSVDKVFIRGVPTLLKITDKKISDNILGSKNVLNELSRI